MGGTPRTLLDELSKRCDWQNLTFSGGLLLGRHQVFTHPNVHYRATFFGGAERDYRDQGADIEFIPSFFRHYGLLIQHLNARVMMMQASMPDENGEVSLSIYNGAHLEECRRAGADPHRLLIVECSPHFPRTRALEGHPHVLHRDEIDVIVYTDAHPTELPGENAAPEDVAIADIAASFIREGSTLQTGIGAIPSLVAQALVRGSGGDFGVHSEMFTDGLHALAAAGKITNARKSENHGISVMTFALGSAAMYEYLDDNPRVGFAPVTYTNDPAVIARNPRMVSINSALEVDLQGQMVADALGGRQYSGVGGHMDFVEGTSLSRDHTSLICLQSTAVVKGMRKSRIIGGMDSHAVVTTPRHLAGVIVTEYGSADLRGLSVRERAQAMVAIAHPDFRDELSVAAESLGR
ncbi:MAG: acetyl-CoA hydrolase/transferase C-terminal domain-containing protein [Actinomycetota bacterium]|nr:acetyl-CoA hydrolase/transferase C-terminal domain-containing protein [Actinomycetota bacterium]